ncbi:MAG: NUDIX hydrolase [Rhodobacteraceae bacterium]|jgi:8-oxo-dGTP pyrophosphatase MutT (NUDIX family)|nr:NUDIX hydrolase [Paracoccaceae bacterium]
MLSRQDAKKLEAQARGRTREQNAAICYRIEDDQLEVLMITTRGTGQWLLPKGWPMPGKKASQTAAIEAWEEAGVKGRVHPREIGRFFYLKVIDESQSIPCIVTVHAIEVTELADDFPEKGQRRRKWLTPRKAASKVEVPGLALLLRKFDRKSLNR